VAQVEAPLGIVMLMLLAAIMLVYLALLALAESRHASAQRRMVREMERLRRLAEQSEESRYGDLRAYVESQFAALDAKLDRIASQQAVMPPEARAEAALPQPVQTHSHPTLRGS
jgi:Tfp pilus assembly protein PilX